MCLHYFKLVLPRLYCKTTAACVSDRSARVFYRLFDFTDQAIFDSTEEQFRDEACVKFVSKAFPMVVHRLLYGEKALQKLEKVNSVLI